MPTQEEDEDVGVGGEDEGNGGGEFDDRPEVTTAQLLQFKSCSAIRVSVELVWKCDVFCI